MVFVHAVSESRGLYNSLKGDAAGKNNCYSAVVLGEMRQGKKKLLSGLLPLAKFGS